MHRPTRQHQHLLQKIATKDARSHKKPGRRTKKWRKWAAQYAPLAQQAEAAG
jgi:hypothetical protein